MVPRNPSAHTTHGTRKATPATTPDILTTNTSRPSRSCFRTFRTDCGHGHSSSVRSMTHRDKAECGLPTRSPVDARFEAEAAAHAERVDAAGESRKLRRRLALAPAFLAERASRRRRRLTRIARIARSRRRGPSTTALRRARSEVAPKVSAGLAGASHRPTLSGHEHARRGGGPPVSDVSICPFTPTRKRGCRRGGAPSAGQPIHLPGANLSRSELKSV